MCSWYRSNLSRRPLPTRYCHLRSSASAICSDWHSTSSTRPDCNWATKFRSQRTSHMEPSATSTTVTGPVREHLQTGTEDTRVLDRPALFRRFHDAGAGYKYPDLLTYLLTCSLQVPITTQCVSHRWLETTERGLTTRCTVRSHFSVDCDLAKTVNFDQVV